MENITKINVGGVDYEVRKDLADKIAELQEQIQQGTGSGGTTDYTDLENKPKINGHELSGNQSSEDLGLQQAGDYALKSEIPDTGNFATKEELNNITPTIGDNGNWFINGEDTGKPANGKDGADGVSLGDIALVQETGTESGSENKVMSQKAVSEKLTELSKRGREITLVDSYKNANKSLKTDGTLKDAGGWFSYYKIPVVAGDSFVANFTMIPSAEGVTSCVIYNSDGNVSETINNKNIDYTFTQEGYISFCYNGTGNYFNIYSFKSLNDEIQVIKSKIKESSVNFNILPWFDKFNGDISTITSDLSLITRTLKDIWFEFPDGKPSWWDSRQPQLRAYNGYGFGSDTDARFIIYFRESKEETYGTTYNYQYRGPRYKGEIEHFRLAIKLGDSSEPTFYMNVVIDTLLLMSIDGTILSSTDSQKIQPMILKNTGTLYNLNEEGTTSINNTIPQIFNTPIRRRNKSERLRLLCFGSSWNMCAWWYLNKIIQSAGINADITGFYTGGAYFSQWIDRYKNNESVDCWKSTNGSDWEKTTANFKDTLNEGWDIIEFQQGAYQAIKWDEEWDPYWSELLSIVKRHCNFDTIIAFNCSYTPGVNGLLSPYPNSQDGQKKWQKLNYENTQKFMALSGIYNVSPGGATMWSLRRESSINTDGANDLSSDNLHPDNGLPIYALGGTFFETYIAPMYGVSFSSVEWKPDTSTSKTPFNFGYQEMNDEQREKVRNIIKLSLSNRFGFNELVE